MEKAFVTILVWLYHNDLWTRVIHLHMFFMVVLMVLCFTMCQGSNSERGHKDKNLLTQKVQLMHVYYSCDVLHEWKLNATTQ